MLPACTAPFTDGLLHTGFCIFSSPLLTRPGGPAGTGCGDGLYLFLQLHRTAEGPSPVLCLHNFTLLLASPDFPPREIILHSVSVSRSCQNKLPQAGQLMPQKCLVSRVWGQKDMIKMPPGSCLLNLERASPRLSQVPWLRGPRPQPLLPCPTSVFSLVSFPFCKDNSHIGL